MLCMSQNVPLICDEILRIRPCQAAAHLFLTCCWASYKAWCSCRSCSCSSFTCCCSCRAFATSACTFECSSHKKKERAYHRKERMEVENEITCVPCNCSRLGQACSCAARLLHQPFPSLPSARHSAFGPQTDQAGSQ